MTALSMRPAVTTMPVRVLDGGAGMMAVVVGKGAAKSWLEELRILVFAVLLFCCFAALRLDLGN